MAKTHQVLTSPVPGTQVKPIHEYTDAQNANIQALRDVSHLFPTLIIYIYHAVVREYHSPTRDGSLPPMGTPMAKSAGHDPEVLARGQV